MCNLFDQNNTFNSINIITAITMPSYYMLIIIAIHEFLNLQFLKKEEKQVKPIVFIIVFIIFLLRWQMPAIYMNF